MIGRQVVKMKRRREFSGGPDESGPRPKENRRSLKLPTQVMNKAITPAGRAVERERGRMVKRQKMGRREKNLSLPLGILEAMK